MPAKLLHIASFIGNIGDNASHLGLGNILNEISTEKPEIEHLEIRKFYKNYTLADNLKFDESFADYANTFDGIIIGGGGFLDYWVPGSGTGTTLDIPQSVIRKIKRPLIISSVGALPHQAVPEGNEVRFKKFLDVALEQDNLFIALRNDGSFENIQENFGQDYAERMHKILDNAFFYSPPIRERLVEQEYVAINLAPDQLSMHSKLHAPLEVDDFYQQIKQVIEHCISSLGLHVVLVPHIQADMTAILKVIQSLESFTARTMVSVAPCIQGNWGAEQLLSIYQNSKFVIATRFHANVCSTAMQKATIGIAVLDRVGFMYDSIGMNQAYVLPGEKLAEELIAKASEQSTNNKIAHSLHLHNLKTDSRLFYESKLGPILK